jgi:hypothetical protein
VESLENNLPTFYLLSIVSEAGASIYSVSPEANKEMPGLDPNLRSAGEKLLPSHSIELKHFRSVTVTN